MPIENPYFHRGPIRKAEYFFNRTQEVTSVLSLLKNNQSVSIVGPRRIGKTSFLLHISQPQIMAEHGLSPDEYIFVFLDCGGLSKLDQAGFYRLILEETQDQLLDQGIEIELPIPETLSYRQFERTLRRLSRQGLKLIYLLDEFELISENHNLDADFFSGLRGLTARHNVSYVTASQAHLLELSYAEGVLGSPFFNIFAVQHLGLLNQAEARRLVMEPAMAAGVTFSDELVEFIVDLAGPHPLFLNIASFHAFTRLQNPSSSPAESGEEMTEQQQIQHAILAEIEGHLHYYWSKLDDREQETLATLKQEDRGETTQVLIHRLEKQGLVIRVSGNYRYPSTALAKFVSHKVAETESRANVTLSGSSPIGRRLGAYLITEQVGHGGMARVFKGRHEALNRDVAIKIISAHLASDEDFLTRFQREAQAVATLRHPNIVQVHDFGAEGEIYYMVMEYVSGGTLQDRLPHSELNGRLNPLSETIQIIHEIAAALEYAHLQGIIHRDLKPANIMLTAEGHVVLADFGLVRLMGSPHFTATGTSWGTPAYMSPEQAQGERGDERSDIYSLGVVFYELVTGRLPFESDTPFGFIMKHINEPVPSPRQLNPELPVAVEQVILKALAKVPDNRYQSANELTEALTAIIFASATQQITV